MPIKIPENSTLPIGFTPDFLETICNLIHYFVLRQQLVVLAMVQHNPGVLSYTVDLDLTPYRHAQRERFLKRKQAIEEQKPRVYRPLPVWKHDWQCFAHGHGCRLTHLRTGERIEWDASDQSAFTIYWFLNHLEWRLKNELDDPYVYRCAEWLNANSADIEVVEKAINCLIELEILNVGGSHVCRFNPEDPELPTDPLTDDVVGAFFNSLLHYHERQQIAIDAMAELRPDFIVQFAEDPYTMPDTATRLKSLYQHLDSLPKSGSRIQTGTWRDGWKYDIRYGTCTLKHKETDESIRWSNSDPLYVDEHGYKQHLIWRFDTEPEHKDLRTMYQWAEQHTNGTSDAFTGLINLIYQLISAKKIKFSRNKKGLSIKWESPHSTS